ncbi:hypothetical protein [Streptomyces montanus]|uniref:hypothetical protein n=1 Tax=Streptomyces montanus TaxID=2580423 RepID=UPI001486F7C3|nr:hypothetical protein [Streptomyces montanus]
MRLGKALATGVAEEQPRVEDEKLPLVEEAGETGETRETGQSEPAAEEVPVAR